jgi:hypothetical protein
MATYKDNFETWLNTMAAGIKDAATLDVSTYSGEVSGLFETDNGSLKFKINNLKAAVDGDKVKLLAHTHQAADRDTLLFVKENLSEQEKELLVLHNSAVTAALESRAAFIKTVISIL